MIDRGQRTIYYVRRIPTTKTPEIISAMGGKIRRKTRTPCGNQQRTGVAYNATVDNLASGGAPSPWCFVKLLGMW